MTKNDNDVRNEKQRRFQCEHSNPYVFLYVLRGIVLSCFPVFSLTLTRIITLQLYLNLVQFSIKFRILKQTSVNRRHMQVLRLLGIVKVGRFIFDRNNKKINSTAKNKHITENRPARLTTSDSILRGGSSQHLTRSVHFLRKLP